MTMIANTVGELRHLLERFSDDAVPITTVPPFSGVAIIPQEDGKVLIGRIETDRGV